jgi:K+-sensing histidine kinase KdpD
MLRTALLGAASDELRSSIAAILGTAGVLDRMLVLQGDEHVRSLVDGMHLEAKRLEGDIQNLLDTARITDTGVKPRLGVDRSSRYPHCRDPAALASPRHP